MRAVAAVVVDVVRPDILTTISSTPPKVIVVQTRSVL